MKMNSSPSTALGIHEGARPGLTIEVYFDFVCPWCLIGKRHLHTAMSRLAEMRPDVDLSVLWRSHQLRPDTPPGGLPYQAFYIARLGRPEAVAARRAQVRHAGTAVGIDFAFERIKVLPNTASAHELVAYATRHCNETQVAGLVERLFVAYFIEGEDIGDSTVLERLGLECELGPHGLAEQFAEFRRSASRTISAPAPIDRHIDGVPCFVFNRSHSVSGANPPDVLLDAMLRSISG
ncbi:thioredoxin, dsba oxidoreductase family protein [Cupriavidus basilensis OR16]|uniref:Thioredoxin, dsba oxidoreductase family protein n=1 Tax=Cupriavidus basilensis OR16 TaxID=1127483 RepID=H1SA82_9BURK|nr:DsbA family oxidoreductase [Cupriavidus basilensis]EHP40631.1 thioredoxin, dsba oxidoreductase family protein [Cupriavidus basilensis OR16]